VLSTVDSQLKPSLQRQTTNERYEKENQDDLELTGFLEFMRTAKLIKHGRRGKPHDRILLLTHNRTRFSWKSSLASYVLLSDIMEVRCGCTTQIFERSERQKYVNEAKKKCCFSMITKSRTLDLETKSEVDRDYWIYGLRLLFASKQNNVLFEKRKSPTKYGSKARSSNSHNSNHNTRSESVRDLASSLCEELGLTPKAPLASST